MDPCPLRPDRERGSGPACQIREPCGTATPGSILQRGQNLHQKALQTQMDGLPQPTSRRPHPPSVTSPADHHLQATHWTLSSAFPLVPPRSVTHPRLPVQHRHRNPRAHPTTLPSPPRHQSPVLAAGIYSTGEALGPSTKTIGDSQLHHAGRNRCLMLGTQKKKKKLF